MILQASFHGNIWKALEEMLVKTKVFYCCCPILIKRYRKTLVALSDLIHLLIKQAPTWIQWSHLIQSSLGHRVVLQTKPLLVVGEVAEDVGQSSWCIWKLVLEGVVVTLLENAAWECLLDKVLDRLKFRRRTGDPHDHRVAITKSGKEVANT